MKKYDEESYLCAKEQSRKYVFARDSRFLDRPSDADSDRRLRRPFAKAHSSLRRALPPLDTFAARCSTSPRQRQASHHSQRGCITRFALRSSAKNKYRFLGLVEPLSLAVMGAGGIDGSPLATWATPPGGGSPFDAWTTPLSDGGSGKSVTNGRGKLVRLNVGGTSFLTSKQTLEKEYSMLRALVSGGYAERQAEEIFIDRDGARFAHVLNYLRDGTLNLQDYNHATREFNPTFCPSSPPSCLASPIKSNVFAQNHSSCQLCFSVIM